MMYILLNDVLCLYSVLSLKELTWHLSICQLRMVEKEALSSMFLQWVVSPHAFIHVSNRALPQIPLLCAAKIITIA